MRGLSIVIKAYNEADKIDAAIRSALRAAREVAPLPVEVIVADGLSRDGTARRAARWSRHAPVQVVQLVHPSDRNCGAGVELGFAASRGDWVFLMDGDMRLLPGFLPRALAFLQSHPRCAGVAGAVEEEALRNGADRIRQRRGLNRQPGLQPWLNGGGLYRREALQDAGGYAGDERLAAFEEADLGLRLRTKGWNLFRLAEPAVLHDGHQASTAVVLWRRWRAGRFEAAGRLLRLHGVGPAWVQAWSLVVHPIGLVMLWLLTITASILLPLLVLGLHLGLRRDWQQVWTAWLDWHLLAVGALQGLCRPWRPRRAALAFRRLGLAA